MTAASPRRAALAAAAPLALALAGLAGCTVGPDYHRPELATPPAFAEPAAPAPPAVDPAHWWRSFGDPTLDRLVETGLSTNLDLQSATSRIRQARQQEVIAGAAGLPQVTANGNALRLQTESHDLTGPLTQALGGTTGGGTTGGGTTTPTIPQISTPSDLEFYSLGFDASWEIDVFGGVRRSVEAARASRDALLWNRRDAEVTVSAEIASDYLDLRWAQAQIAVLNQQAASQRETLKVVADRASTELATGLDVSQEQAQALATEAQIPALQARIRGDAHALAALLDQPVAALDAQLGAPIPPPPTPAAPGTGLPSELLRRRPDVRAAERRLAAATAQIGVATADLYPRFNLMGLVSMGGMKPANAIDPNHLTGIGLAQIQWPIFEGGRIRANIAADREAALQAYLAYRQAVTRAITDVEDALSRLDADAETEARLMAQLAASDRAAVLARQQYRVGLQTLDPVLRAEQSSLQARNSLAQVQASHARDLAALYKALGGGWDEAETIDLKPTTYPKGAPQ